MWLFDASFAPKTATKISHRYTVFTGSNLSWVYDIAYVVKTGRGWNGKIGSAKFRVKLPPAAHTVSLGDYKKPPVLSTDEEGNTHYLLERRDTDWVPPNSIGMAFVFTSWSDINERLGEDRFTRSGVREEDECTAPTAPESAAQAQMCKNLIYAISGYPFKSEKLRKYFYGNQFDWRRKKDHWLGEVWVRGLKPIGGFTPARIPALDRSFLRYIDTLKFDEAPATEDVPSTPTPEATPADARADAKLKEALKSPNKAGATRKQKPEPRIQAPPPSPSAPKSPSPRKIDAVSQESSGCTFGSITAGRGLLPFLTLGLVGLLARFRRREGAV